MNGSNNKSSKKVFRERPTKPPFPTNKHNDDDDDYEEADASSYDADYDSMTDAEQDNEERRDQPLVGSDSSAEAVVAVNIPRTQIPTMKRESPLSTSWPPFVTSSASGPALASYGSLESSRTRRLRHHASHNGITRATSIATSSTFPRPPGIARAHSERYPLRNSASTNQHPHHQRHHHKLPQRHLQRYSSEPNVYLDSQQQFLPDVHMPPILMESPPSYHQLSSKQHRHMQLIAQSLPPSTFTRDDTYIPLSPSRHATTRATSLSLPNSPVSPTNQGASYARSHLTASLGSIPERHHLRLPFASPAALPEIDENQYLDPTAAPLLPPRPLGANSFSAPGSFFTTPTSSLTASMIKTHHSPGASHPRRHASSLYVDDFMKEYVGTEQPNQCRGIIYAILFVCQVAFVISMGIVQCVSIIREQRRYEITEPVNYLNIIGVTCISGIFACALSGVVLFTMTIVYKRLIQIALVLAISLSFLWGILGVAVLPGSYVPATGFIACMLCTGYTVVVWRHIPFASANLHAALTAVKSTPSIWVVAFLFQLGALVWSIGWTFTAISVYYYAEKYSWIVKVVTMLLMALSYYWTFEVIVVSTVSGFTFICIHCHCAV